MLIEFTIGNYKSFRDKTTFSMVAAPLRSEDTRLDRDNVLPVSKNLSLLRSAALYGANASGKSNMGAALRFLREFVLSSAGQPRERIPVEPFLLNTETREQPSFFEIVFRYEGIQYRYGFEVNRQEVVSEWLFHVPKTRETALFLRDGQDIDVRAGFSVARGLEGRTRPDALFLSVAAQFNVQKPALWFGSLVVTTGLQDDYRRFTLSLLDDDTLKRHLTEMLSGMDLGFLDLGLLLRPTVDQRLSEELRQLQEATTPDRLYTVHPVFDAQGRQAGEQRLEMDVHESQGTRKMVALSGLLWRHLRYGGILFIDELDARLHPLMTRHVIEMFHSPDTNPNGAQLIFATHDSNLLDRALFRRDQIWFAEKDRQGATHLYSLAEYSPRNDAAFEKNYLVGRYGAIPYLGDPTRLPGVSPSPDREAVEESDPAAEAALA